jgi:Protein of unknown function (Hypoth_ymh)
VSAVDGRGPVNYDRALEVVERYIALINDYEREYRKRSNAKSGTTTEMQARAKADAIDAELRTRLPLIITIGSQFYANFDSTVTPSYGIWAFSGVKNGVLMLRGSIRDAREAQDIVGEVGPRISAADLHPIVWNAAARLWDGGHFRQAVESAATAVDDSLRAKLGRSDIRGAALIAQAFTKEEPEPGKPRLRFSHLDPNDRDTWTNAHLGAMHFGTGCMMGIRNLVAHSPDEIDPQIALEQLAALSVLARWIDATIVVKPPGG